MKLLLIYLNKCLVEIIGKKSDEVLIQEAFDIFDSFISFFISLESELIVKFLRSDLKEFKLVMKQTIAILLESDRIYFHDAMVSLIIQFISRMRVFGQSTILNLYYCEIIFSEILKEISKIDLISIQVAKAFVLLYHQTLKLLPLSTKFGKNKEKLKLFASPLSFLRNVVRIFFQVPFLFQETSDICSRALENVASEIEFLRLEDSVELNMKDEIAGLALFSAECSMIFSLKKNFSAADILKCFRTGLSDSVFSGFVLPFVLLNASIPLNHLECGSFLNQVSRTCEEKLIKVLIGIVYKRLWYYELPLSHLSISNIRCFAYQFLSQNFIHHGATFLLSILDTSKTDLLYRLEICKCLAQISINQAIGGEHSCCGYFECISNSSILEPKQAFFTSLLSFTGDIYGATLEEQESLGLWAFSITKHITKCKFIKNHPHSYRSLSECFLQLITRCQKKKTPDLLNQAFFITWGILLGSGTLTEQQISSHLKNEKELEYSSMIPPCSTSILLLAFEVLLLLRKCPFLDIRIRVLELCKILIGSLPRLKVIRTDYSALSSIYALVLGMDTITTSSYIAFDSLENNEKIVKVRIEILDFGYKYHYMTFHSTTQKHSKKSPSPLIVTHLEKTDHMKLAYTYPDRCGGGSNVMYSEMESFMARNTSLNEIDSCKFKEEPPNGLETSIDINQLMKSPIFVNQNRSDVSSFGSPKNGDWKMKLETDFCIQVENPKLLKNNDDILRYEDLVEVPESSNIIEEFISANTRSEEQLPILDDNETKLDLKQESVLNTGESFFVKQSALIKLPFAKKNITKSIPLVIRHLLFSKNNRERVNYFHIYSHGLLCGSLQFKNIYIRKDIPSRGVDALHPMIKNIASLDLHLILELLQDFEMQNVFDGEDELFSWISGLTDVHRHLLSFSRSIHETERQLKRDLTIAECLVIARDKLSIIKLSINNSLVTEADIDKLGLANNLGIEQSRVMGSMILLEDSFSKWLSYLL